MNTLKQFTGGSAVGRVLNAGINANFDTVGGGRQAHLQLAAIVFDLLVLIITTKPAREEAGLLLLLGAGLIFFAPTILSLQYL